MKSDLVDHLIDIDEEEVELDPRRKHMKIKDAPMDPDKRYAFRVTLSIYTYITVQRYELVKTTKSTVTFLSEYGVETTRRKEAIDEQWFPSPVLAAEFARAHIEAHTLRLQKQLTQLKRSAALIDSGSVLIVTPIPVKSRAGRSRL
jgi:hypothetical protein